MLYAVISLAAMGAVFGVMLAVASKKFAVEVDPRVEEILQALPGVNCGSCGFAGCSGYAEAVVKGEAPVGACNPGGAEAKQKMAAIMGTDTADSGMERKIARLLCNGSTSNSSMLYKYEGIEDCHAAAVHYSGPKACHYGCLGLGSCVKACPFGAIKMGTEGLPVINTDLCTGCNICVQTCPKQLLQLAGISQLVDVRCRNKGKAKEAKDVCKAACIKCKLCEKNCPEGAVQVVTDNEGSVAVIDHTKCTNCGICVTKCPTKAIEKASPIKAEVCAVQDGPSENKPAGCGSCHICG